jgi:hypothetical protein
LQELSDAYADLAGENLQAIAKLDRDPVRARIDAAIEKALGLPALSTLREMLARTGSYRPTAAAICGIHAARIGVA